MWRIDPAPKLVPDHESYLDILVRERNEAEAGRLVAEVKSRRDSIKRIVSKRFGTNVTQSVESEIDAITDMERLNLIFDEAITTTSIDDLRKIWA